MSLFLFFFGGFLVALVCVTFYKFIQYYNKYVRRKK